MEGPPAKRIKKGNESNAWHDGPLTTEREKDVTSNTEEGGGVKGTAKPYIIPRGDPSATSRHSGATTKANTAQSVAMRPQRENTHEPIVTTVGSKHLRHEDERNLRAARTTTNGSRNKEKSRTESEHSRARLVETTSKDLVDRDPKRNASAFVVKTQGLEWKGERISITGKPHASARKTSAHRRRAKELERGFPRHRIKSEGREKKNYKRPSTQTATRSTLLPCSRRNSSGGGGGKDRGS